MYVCSKQKKLWLSQWKTNSKLWRDKMVVKLYMKSECMYKVLITYSYKVLFVYSFLIDFCVILLLWSSNLALAGLGRMTEDSTVFHLTQKWLSVWQQAQQASKFFEMEIKQVVDFTCVWSSPLLTAFTALNLFAQYNDNTNFQHYLTYRPLLLACTTVLFSVLVPFPFNKQPVTRIPPPQHSNSGEEVFSREWGKVKTQHCTGETRLCMLQ